MLEALVSSKTRIKLLLKFFINPAIKAHLREIANEFGESTNGIRLELNRMNEAGLLIAKAEGKTIRYQANHQHPLFPELKAIVGKYTGIDQLVQGVFARLGDLEAAYIVGDFAAGRDTGIIDVILIGFVNEETLQQLTKKAESLAHRKLRTLVLTQQEWISLFGQGSQGPTLLVWQRD